MKANPVKRKRFARSLMAVLAGGTLLVDMGQSGCARVVQREMEVLTHPEANADEFYNSYLMNNSWGRQLIEWWNIRG